LDRFGGLRSKRPIGWLVGTSSTTGGTVIRHLMEVVAVFTRCTMPARSGHLYRVLQATLSNSSPDSALAAAGGSIRYWLPLEGAMWLLVRSPRLPSISYLQRKSPRF